MFISKPGSQTKLDIALSEARRSQFPTLHQAIECANLRFSTGENQWIVIGDNGAYWVVSPSSARQLVSAGYSLAFGN